MQEVFSLAPFLKDDSLPRLPRLEAACKAKVDQVQVSRWGQHDIRCIPLNGASGKYDLLLERRRKQREVS